ncbi:MAG: B12-binding domain-containing radical SAM protein [Bacteroidales bacterium]|nr:radical SAM protein [Bacteroidales bacterium]
MEKSCLLIVPHYISGSGSILKSFSYSMPPVGLLSIAGYLKENNIEVNLLDYTIESFKKRSVEEILLEKIDKISIPKWFGISVCTPVAYNAYEIVELIRKNYPESKIVLGGPHITVLKEKVFEECPEADFLVIGEGEYALYDLIENEDPSADNIIVKNEQNDIAKVKAKDVVVENLPMPAYDILGFEKYVPPPASLQSKKPGIGIIASRGCPYKCSFCARITGNRLKFKQIEQLIDEIKYLKEKFKIKQFHFYDDTITSKKSYIMDLCQRFIDENLNLHWSCFARVDTVDEEVLTLMRKSGCFVIMYGVESLDERVLKDVNKGINIKQINEALILTRKAKIESRISLIIGTPTETRESLNKTKRELLKLDTDFFQTFIAVPMPGSKFFDEALAQNRLINTNWNEYDLSKVLYRHSVFTEKELFREQRNMYLRFYLRPKIIFNLFKSINSFTAIKNIFRGFSGFIQIILSSK